MSDAFVLFWLSTMVFLMPTVGHVYFNTLCMGRYTYNNKVGYCVAVITFLLLFMARNIAMRSHDETAIPTAIMLIVSACILVLFLPQE